MIIEFFNPTDYITGASGYSLFGDASFGDNGDFFVPELTAGRSTSDSVGAHTTWDPDLSDGLDNGPAAISFSANMDNGTVSMTSYGDETTSLDYDGQDNLGSIGSVQIKVGAQVPGLVTFSDITITFWKDGVAQETQTASGSAAADAENSATGVQEQILLVTPGATDCDGVTVAGTFSMQAGPDVYPGWNDLFAQILIMPAA